VTSHAVLRSEEWDFLWDLVKHKVGRKLS